MGKLRIILSIGGVLLLLASPALAAEFIAPNRGSGSVIIGQNEIHKDLYLAGANVSVSGTIDGDLYAVGGSVSVDGTVEKDLGTAGGNVVINGNVADDARIAGGNVTINSEIGSDLLIGAGNLLISNKAKIGGDLVAGAGTLTLNAPVVGNVKIGGGEVTINSEVTGNVEVNAEEGLTFGPNAVISGSIFYKGPKEAVVSEGAKVSVITFEKMARGGKGAKIIFGAGFFITLAALLIASLAKAYLFKGALKKVIGDIFEHPWINLGLGLAGLILTPILAIILFVTVIGYYLGLILLFMYIVALLGSIVLAILFLGSWTLKLALKRTELSVGWQEALTGTILIMILSVIPVVGWIAIFILMLLGFGVELRWGKSEIVRFRQG